MSRVHRAAVAALLLAPVLALPVRADAVIESGVYNPAVRSITAQGVPDACIVGQALPCTPGAGIGTANVIEVTQSRVAGVHRFNGLRGTSADREHLWMALQVGAQCRAGYKLFQAEAVGHEPPADGMWFDEPEVGEAPFAAISVPFARTMSPKLVALTLPLDAHVASGFSEADLFAAGEAEISRRIADGMSNARARALPYELNTALPISVRVVCRGNVGAHFKWEKSVQVLMPFKIRYIPVVLRDPVGDVGRPGGLVASARVDAASLSVVSDPTDSCTVHLSATFTTNRATHVQYRFIDPYGRPSGLHDVQVGSARVAMVSQPVAVPQADSTPPTGTLVTPGTSASGISGSFTLEVVSPNRVVAVDGFSIPWCTPDPQTTGVGGSGGGGDLLG